MAGAATWYVLADFLLSPSGGRGRYGILLILV